VLFLVISQPTPVEPSMMRHRREQFWTWARPQLADGTLRDVHARVGRGAVATFDVESNEELHRRLTQWSELVPAEFTVYPLVDRDVVRQLLGEQEGSAR
jgi:muconolactone delta-isomerase